MRKFTKLKALAMSAMMILGTTTAFGQPGGGPGGNPGGNPGGYNPGARAWNVDLKTAQKPILYAADGNDVLPGFPGNSFKSGVYFRGFTEDNNNPYYPEKTSKPTSNPTETVVWTSGDSLGVFLGDKQRGEILFDLSTKYLTDVNTLSFVLNSDNFGVAATTTAEWYARVSVYNLNGNLVRQSDLFVGGNNNNAVFTTRNPIFSTRDGGPKTIYLFDLVKDDLTDITQFNETGLSNKLIRIELYSDYVEFEGTESGSKSHFAPALVVSNFQMNFAEPGLELTASKTSFNAGMGRTSCDNGTLTMKAMNIQFPGGTKVQDAFVYTYPTSNYGDILYTRDNFELKNAAATVTGTYDFQPDSIGTYSGKFQLTSKASDPLSPIRLSASTATVSGNSIPHVEFDEGHVYFNKNFLTKKLGISGYNIPAGVDLDFSAYEKRTTDQEWYEYGDIDVDEVFNISSCGKIEGSDGDPYLNLTLAQWTNDITRAEAWQIRIRKSYRVENAFPNSERTSYNGVRIYPYPTAIAAARIGALWLTYEGVNFDGTEGRFEADNVFFAPYDKRDPLDNTRRVSRVKTYMLHGSELKPSGDDGIAIIKITIQNLNLDYSNPNDDDNQEFRFKLNESDPWINNNTDTLTLSIDTYDDALMKKFREEGLPIYVQFVPNKAGFENPELAEEKYWQPDTYELQAWVVEAIDENSVMDDECGCYYNYVRVVAGLYGDTRANLWSNINNLSYIEEMHNSWRPAFGNMFPELVYPEFQKYYGKAYLDDCDYNNPFATDSFYVAGYNLKKKVDITKAVNVEAYPNAFTYVIKDMLNDGRIVDELTPNEYGEVLGLVIVTFNPKDEKVAGVHKAEDVITVASNENVVHWQGCECDDYPQPYNNMGSSNGHLEPYEDFYYNLYVNEGEVYGMIYKPTITFEYETPISGAVDGATQIPVTVRGEEFNPARRAAIKRSLTKVGYDNPFTLKLAAGDVVVDANGQFSVTDVITYAPTAINACATDNSFLVEAPCLTAEKVIEATPTVSGVPSLLPMTHGDIDGSTAIIKWNKVPGADYYKVKVGKLSPINTSKNVFISEVLASKEQNVLAVELFNGTGKVINPKMLVNYYLQVERTDKSGKVYTFYGHFKNEDINITDLNGGWHSTAKIISTYSDKKGTDENAGDPVQIVISDNYRYTVRLMEGENQIDIFTFGEAGAHLARKSQNGLPMNQGDFNIAEWETINTSLVNGEATAYYMWQDEDNVEFSILNGAESSEIHATHKDNLTADGKYMTAHVINLKPNSLYDVQVTAYHPCLYPNGISALGQDFITTSEFVVGTGDVEIRFGQEGSVTPNETISTEGVQVLGGNGSVTIYNATGKKVVVRNVLGQLITNTVIASDIETISAPAGVVVVTVDGGTTVKALVK